MLLTSNNTQENINKTLPNSLISNNSFEYEFNKLNDKTNKPQDIPHKKTTNSDPVNFGKNNLQGQNSDLNPTFQQINSSINPSSASSSNRINIHKIYESSLKSSSSLDTTSRLSSRMPSPKDSKEQIQSLSQLKAANNILLSAFDEVLNGNGKKTPIYSDEKFNKLVNDDIVSRNGQTEILKVNSLKSQQKKNPMKINLRRKNKENLGNFSQPNDIKNNLLLAENVQNIQQASNELSHTSVLSYTINNSSPVYHFDSKSESLALNQTSNPFERILANSEVKNTSNRPLSSNEKTDLLIKNSKSEISRSEALPIQEKTKIDKENYSKNQIAQNYPETKQDQNLYTTLSSNRVLSPKNQSFAETNSKLIEKKHEQIKTGNEQNISDKLDQPTQSLIIEINDKNRIDSFLNKYETPKVSNFIAEKDETPSFKVDGLNLDSLVGFRKGYPDTILETQEEMNSTFKNVGHFQSNLDHEEKLISNKNSCKQESESKKSGNDDDQLLVKKLSIDDFQKLRNSLGSRNSPIDLSQNKLSNYSPQTSKANETLSQKLINPYEFHNLRKNAETPTSKNNINEDKLSERKSKRSSTVESKSPRNTIKDIPPYFMDFISSINKSANKSPNQNKSKSDGKNIFFENPGAIASGLAKKIPASAGKKNKGQSKFDTKEDDKSKSPKLRRVSNVNSASPKENGQRKLSKDNDMVQGRITEQYINHLKQKLKTGDRPSSSHPQVQNNKIREFTLGAVSVSESISFEHKDLQQSPRINGVSPSNEEIKSLEEIKLNSNRKVKSFDKVECNPSFVSFVPRKYGSQLATIPTKDSSESNMKNPHAKYQPLPVKKQNFNPLETNQNEEKENSSPTRPSISNIKSESAEFKADASIKIEEIPCPFSPHDLPSQRESISENPSIYTRSPNTITKYNDKHDDFGQMISVYSKKSLDSANSSIIKEKIKGEDIKYIYNIPKSNNLQSTPEVAPNHNLYQTTQNTALNETRLSKMDENEAAQLYEKRKFDILNDIKKISKKKIISNDKKLPKNIENAKKFTMKNNNDQNIKSPSKVRVSLNRVEISKPENQSKSVIQKTSESRLTKDSSSNQRESPRRMIKKTLVNKKDVDDQKQLKSFKRDIGSSRYQDNNQISLKKRDEKYWIGKKISDSPGFSPKAVDEISSINYGSGDFNKDEPLDKSDYPNESHKSFGKNEEELGNELSNTGAFAETIKTKKERILQQIENIDKQLADELSGPSKLNPGETISQKQNANCSKNRNNQPSTLVNKTADNTQRSNEIHKSKFSGWNNQTKSRHQSPNLEVENKLNRKFSQANKSEIKPATEGTHNMEEFKRVLFGNKDPSSYNTNETYRDQKNRKSSKNIISGVLKKTNNKLETPITEKKKSLESRSLTPKDVLFGVTNECNQNTLKQRNDVLNLSNIGSKSVRNINMRKISSPSKYEKNNFGSKSLMIKPTLKILGKENNDYQYFSKNSEENLPLTARSIANKELKKLEVTEYLSYIILINQY